MPTYVWRASHQPSTLALTDRAVRIAGPSPSEWPWTQLEDERVVTAALHQVPFLWWLELRAVAAHGPIPPSPPIGRPSVKRVQGFGQPGNPSVPGFWILGRHARIASHAGPDLSLADLAAHGLPASVALPPALGEALLEAARTLAPLPCFCGTGVEDIAHHDALDVLVRLAHPFATFDCLGAVGRCRVCQRTWIFETSGDSHYGYSYQVTAWVGPSVETP